MRGWSGNIIIVLLGLFLVGVESFSISQSLPRYSRPPSLLRAGSNNSVLERLASVKQDAQQYAAMFGLEEGPEDAFHALFLAIKSVPLGFKGYPFVLRDDALADAWKESTGFRGFFTMNDLEQAVQDDFLDAARGSTDNRKGWQITDVSVPRGDSFEEARMTIDDVEAALDKGTVIMNAAGAHIPKLAGPSLAMTDATALPCALNLYVTKFGKRTSAPPHTDKQDVMVVQTAGEKHWKVFAAPKPSDKPLADPFARGKMDDSLPLYQLADTCELLLETTLKPGDVLFIPAGFPHTTSTMDVSETSVHLTFGIDHHIWDLDYLSLRRIAHQKAGVPDRLQADNPFTGPVNALGKDIYADLTAELPLGLLEEDNEDMVESVVREAKRIAAVVDESAASQISNWKEVTIRLRDYGVELLEIHRDMYLAAIEEGRVRASEAAMTAHLDNSKKVSMSPERVQRLSLFRVQRFFDQISVAKDKLKDWSTPEAAIDDNWEFTAPVRVGSHVEADLGGAFFAATVTRASGSTYDVQFFDGDRETGLSREQIKLLEKPAVASEQKMTAKQLKRLRKEQKKLQRSSS